MEKKCRQDGDRGADTQEAQDVSKERAVAATRKHVRLQNTSGDTVHVISKYPGRMHTNDLHATLLALMGRITNVSLTDMRVATSASPMSLVT
jgi:hypothetical protein